MYPDLPVKINFQNTTHVGFTVSNTFGGSISNVFTQYHSGSFGETECLEEENVENTVDIDFMAQCMRATKISIVNLWLTDCSETDTFLTGSDNAEIPECCHPGEVCKTVQYTFKLPCVPEPCPETAAPIEQVDPLVPLGAMTEPPDVDSDRYEDVGGGPVRRHLSGNVRQAHDIIKEQKKREGSTREFEDIVGRAEENDLVDHFCVMEDYPCGSFGDKVHVCHYSARDGYKTFCVPEADSDALRFYPKDYCGPCVGGYASA